MVVRYDIPDDFELGNVRFDPSCKVRVPDYHPLSEEEIFELLQIASRSDCRVKGSIQARLAQGIKGQVTPRLNDDGILDRKETYLDSLFVAIVNEPDQHKAAAKKMFDIMNYDD